MAYKKDAPYSNVSTHSRLKAAVLAARAARRQQGVSTHSRLKAADPQEYSYNGVTVFQHTAA